MAGIITLLLAVLAVAALHVRLALSNPPKYKSSIEGRQSIIGKDPFDHSWVSEWQLWETHTPQEMGLGSVWTGRVPDTTGRTAS